jgi:hypothetical protein
MAVSFEGSKTTFGLQKYGGIIVKLQIPKAVIVPDTISGCEFV